MKNTRRFISAVMALAMVSAIAPMSAIADTTIIPDPDDMPNPKPSSANTEVEFSVEPTYTVTIPAKVELADNGSGTYANTGILTAEDVFLEPNQAIAVTISGDFKLENEIDSGIKVSYQAEGPLGIVGNGDIVTLFGTSDNSQSAAIQFRTTEEPQYAGDYSDTVTFGIAVENGTGHRDDDDPDF